MGLTIAILGRPNVGKSLLFNRLAKKKLAIVDDTPGVTRDWRTADAELLGVPVTLIDTAGLEERFDGSIEHRMRGATEHALARADVILFMVDGRAGITPLDAHFASWLRRQDRPVRLLLNKAENPKAVESALAEAYGLGLGDPIPVSAAHGDGMELLAEALLPFLPEDDEDDADQDGTEGGFIPDSTLDELEGSDRDILPEAEPEEEEKAIRIAIIGRPNAGKSTLLNTLIGEERTITGPEAGLTRDAIAVEWTHQGRRMRLVDTAGLRRKAKVQNAIEKMAVEDTMRAIRLAQIVILMIDSVQGLDKQDLQIARHVIEEGRALILACNKWDAIDNHKEVIAEIEYRLDVSLGQIKNLPVVRLSALTGRHVEKLMKSVFTTFDLWSKRIRTAKLNGWLAAMEARHPPPLVDGKPNRLRYITQIKVRPPTFALWCARPDDIPESYRRYIVNGLREDFDIPGVPIRLLLRTSKNPYVS